MSKAWPLILNWKSLTSQQKRANVQTTVLGVKPGRIRRFRYGKPQPSQLKHIPTMLVEDNGLSTSYLGIFFEEPFPDFPSLNCRLLLRAWHVILDLAQLLFALIPEPTQLSQAEAEVLALSVRYGEMRALLKSTLKVTDRDTSLIINFLSFHPKISSGQRGHRGFWSAPLIVVPRTDLLALPLSVLATSNPLRKCEAWLERGGIRDDLKQTSRGAMFEAALRESIATAIINNPLLNDTRSSRYAIKKAADFEEEIDIIIQVGNLLFVGEVKFHLTPAEAQEEYRHSNKLRSAANQALSKANLLRSRREKVVSALEISEEKAAALIIIPLIIDCQDYGLGSMVDGVRVTEANYLLMCLGSGMIDVSAALNPTTGATLTKTMILYRDQDEAEKVIQELLAKPPTMYRYIDRVVWTELPYPTSNGDNLWQEVVTIGDLAGDDKDDAQYMRDLVSL